MRLLLILLVNCAMAVSVMAAGNIADRVNSANQAWLRKDYLECQAILSGVVKSFGTRKGIYGPKFGVIYYKKGMAELRLAYVAKRNGDGLVARRWFALAAESFRICYEEFPNDEKHRADG